MDGDNNLSYFLLMLPFWIAAIPLFAYIILTGLAASNTRINKYEKFVLSIFVPIGFLATFICIIWLIDNQNPDETNNLTNENKPKLLKVIFLPHFLSLLCLYLYLRCLVRPTRIQNFPATNLNSPN